MMRPPSGPGRLRMTCFAGLDVSTKTTSVCVITSDGEVLLETSVATQLRPSR